MGSKYTTQSVSGYNSSPPADDGTQSESNKVKWSTVKTKIGDPLNTFAAAADAAILEALNYGTNTQAGNYATVAGDNGKVVQVTGSGTVTLIAASTATSNYRVYIYNGHSAAITVARSGSDTINGASKNLSIAPGQLVCFQANAAANGYLTGISALCADQTDPSKQAVFSMSGITTGTVRTITVPDADVTLGLGAAAGVAQTFLASDVNLNNTSNYFNICNTGSIGASGQKWLLIGVCNLSDTAGAAALNVRIWDTSTVFCESTSYVAAANQQITVTVMTIVSPSGAATYHLSAKDATSTSGIAQTTGAAGTANKATSITAIRLV